MNWFYPDASAFVKRYSSEKGTDFMNRLLDTLLPLTEIFYISHFRYLYKARCSATFMTCTSRLRLS